MVAGVGGVFHFAMMVKADLREPMVYAAVLSLLLGYRVVAAARARSIQTRHACHHILMRNAPSMLHPDQPEKSPFQRKTIRRL